MTKVNYTFNGFGFGVWFSLLGTLQVWTIALGTVSIYLAKSTDLGEFGKAIKMNSEYK